MRFIMLVEAISRGDAARGQALREEPLTTSGGSETQQLGPVGWVFN